MSTELHIDKILRFIDNARYNLNALESELKAVRDAQKHYPVPVSANQTESGIRRDLPLLCEQLGLSETAFYSHARHQHLAMARQVIIWFLMRKYPITQKELAPPGEPPSFKHQQVPTCRPGRHQA